MDLVKNSLAEGFLTSTRASQVLGVKPRNVDPLIYTTGNAGWPVSAYLLDANVLITANSTYYPLDQIPEFWSWVHHQANANRLKTPGEIMEEIKAGRKDRRLTIVPFAPLKETHTTQCNYGRTALQGLIHFGERRGFGVSERVRKLPRTAGAVGFFFVVRATASSTGEGGNDNSILQSTKGKCIARYANSV